MGIEEVVNLSIVATTAPPARASFGTPLIMCYHSVVPDLVYLISQPSDLIDAGWAITDPAYRAASAVFSQNPRCQQVAIGKRTSAYTQVVKLTPVKTTVGYTYSFTFVSPTGVATPISYVVQPSDTATIIATAIVALFTGVTGVTAALVSGGPTFSLTAASGKLFNLKGLPRPQDLTVLDSTTDPGIAADLAAVYADNPDSWYSIGFDHSGKAEIAAAAAWVETVRKLCIVNTSDTECITSSTSDIASTIKNASYVRTDVLFSGNELLSYSALAWQGVMLPKNPGSATWAFKQLAGITPDVLNTSQKNYAKTKNLNTYTPLAKQGRTQWGQAGGGQYTDIVLGTDWLFARIQEAEFAVFASNDKVPFTDSGVDSLRSAALAVLKTATTSAYNLLATTPAPLVTFPLVADVSDIDRQNRHLPGGTFTARYQGAVHTVDIAGTISF